jgi:hypothetical protein
VLVVTALLAVFNVVSTTSAGPSVGELQSPVLDAIAADGTWSSGWLDIQQNQVLTLNHDMGGDPGTYAVDLWYRDTDEGGLGLNHRAIGGMEAAGQFYGITWQRLTDTSVEVYRFANDVFADQVLLRIWVADPPEYDSGWVDKAPGSTLILNHNVGGDADDYIVGMRFNDTRPQGLDVNIRCAGGLEVAGNMYGAAWHQLTSEAIHATRFTSDTCASQIRIQIYVPDPPDYDSGWQDMQTGENLTLDHNLGGNPLTYVVRVSAKDVQAGSLGINNWYGGGIAVGENYYGSNWERLTDTTIDLFRQPQDDFVHSSDRVRVRIWKREFKVYLPTVMNAVSSAGQAAATRQ